ncbi:MAG: hypothetical protein QOE61_6132 [Micromonosporaceae bacterium]|nr:hypothetical protein [Micromonosporaceae bacterium]
MVRTIRILVGGRSKRFPYTVPDQFVAVAGCNAKNRGEARGETAGSHRRGSHGRRRLLEQGYQDGCHERRYPSAVFIPVVTVLMVAKR